MELDPKTKTFSTNGPLILLVIVILIAILIRAGICFIYPNMPVSTDWQNVYHPSAVALFHGQGLKISNSAMNGSPIYVSFLSLFYLIFGPGIIAMRISQIALEGLVVFFLFILGNQVFNSRVGLLAALGYAIYPPAIYMTGLGQPEVTLAVFLILLILIWNYADTSNSHFAYAGVGILLGAVLLIKPNYYGFLPFWVMVEILRFGKNCKRNLFRMSIALATAFMVVSPWFLIRTGGDHTRTKSNLYANIIYSGSRLRPTLSDGSLMPLREFYKNQMRILENQTGGAPITTLIALRATFENYTKLIRPNPIRLFDFIIHKFSQIWYATDTGTADKFFRYFQIPFVIAGIGGWIVAFQKPEDRAKQWPLFLILSYTILALMLITPLFREILPVMPIAFIYIACAFDYIVFKKKLCNG